MTRGQDSRRRSSSSPSPRFRTPLASRPCRSHSTGTRKACPLASTSPPASVTKPPSSASPLSSKRPAHGRTNARPSAPYRRDVPSVGASRPLGVIPCRTPKPSFAADRLPSKTLCPAALLHADINPHTNTATRAYPMPHSSAQREGQLHDVQPPDGSLAASPPSISAIRGRKRCSPRPFPASFEVRIDSASLERSAIAAFTISDRRKSIMTITYLLNVCYLCPHDTKYEEAA